MAEAIWHSSFTVLRVHLRYPYCHPRWELCFNYLLVSPCISVIWTNGRAGEMLATVLAVIEKTQRRKQDIMRSKP